MLTTGAGKGTSANQRIIISNSQTGVACRRSGDGLSCGMLSANEDGLAAMQCHGFRLGPRVLLLLGRMGITSLCYPFRYVGSVVSDRPVELAVMRPRSR
jgi:hypothetical protein